MLEFCLYASALIGFFLAVMSVILVVLGLDTDDTSAVLVGMVGFIFSIFIFVTCLRAGLRFEEETTLVNNIAVPGQCGLITYTDDKGETHLMEC